MDNLIVGLIGLLALVYVGSKIYKQMTGTGGCGCGGGGSTKSSSKKDTASSGCGCGSGCSCGDNSALGLKPANKE